MLPVSAETGHDDLTSNDEATVLNTKLSLLKMQY